ncbi:Golgi complex component 7 (COG7) [Ceratobasidium sp. AG-Ba]|nr:Golgi complex component 7 (COG7) [Ceratobasidium sp. AG-Ba]
MASEMDAGLDSLNLDASLSSSGDNIVDWVNQLLDPALPEPAAGSDSSIGDLGNLDKTIINLIARFDVIAQETASKIDTTIADVTRTMPRLHFDVQVMRESALSLQSALHTLSHQSTSLLPSQDSKDETNSALTRLHTLSQTHSNMTAAHALLKKAESWSALEPDVTRLLANSEFDAAADRLAASTDSLQVFEGTPEYESAKGLMVSLQNQLEAGLSTAVVNAVNGLDFDTCKRYYAIFCRIQREIEFKYYYNGIRRTSLVKLWATYGDSDLSFADFISKFFGEFLALVHAERQNMTKVYPDPQDCLAEFILTTVESLQPSLVQRLESEGLKGLISALETVQEFVSSVGKTLEAMILFSPGLPTTPGRNPSGSLLRKPSHNRRTSKRFSISQRNDGKSLLRTDSAPELETIPPWELSLLEPFLEHQTDYASLELKLLNQSFEQKSAGRTQTLDGAKKLHDAVADVVGLAEDAVSRCVAFTHTFGAKELASTLDQFCAGVFEGAKEQCLPSPTTTTTTTAAGAVPPDEDLDYTAEDWSAFQLALRLLEGCRAAEDRLESLENRVVTRIAQAHRLSVGVPRSEIQLLSQSPLNTPENQALLAQWESSKTPSSTQFLTQTREAHRQFTIACQSLVRDTILSPLKLRLTGYPFLTEWTEVDTSTGPGQLKLPKFSASATSSVQSVAEGLLNLPRLFEVYADDNALAFSLHTLPFIGRIEEEGTELVTSTWLSSLTLSFCAHVTDVILPAISSLTPLGARQLASDLEYLSNVVRTLGVEPEVLEEWRAATDMSDQDGIARAREIKESGGKVTEGVFGKVALLRGWAVIGDK